MPIVKIDGKTKHFPYTPKGLVMAKRASKKMGKPYKTKKSMKR